MSDFSNLPATSPQHAMGVVAPPRLWDGDDPAGYGLLQERVSASLGPKDFLEEIWERDVVDLVWEIFRLRGMKSDLMREAAHKGVVEVLLPRSALHAGNIYETAKKWACGDQKAAAAVNHVLATSGLTMDAVRARTFVAFIDRFECIDRMTMMAEQRRDTALREIERHRERFAKRLRRAIDDVEDAEFKDITVQEARRLARTEAPAPNLSTEGGVTSTTPAGVAPLGAAPQGAAPVGAA